MRAAQAAALARSKPHGAEIGEHGGVGESDAVSGWTKLPLRLHGDPGEPDAQTLGPQVDVSTVF